MKRNSCLMILKVYVLAYQSAELMVVSSRNQWVLINSVDIYLLKVNNRNARTMYKICSKLITNTPELWTYFIPCSSVSIVNFEHVNADWESRLFIKANYFFVFFWKKQLSTGPMDGAISLMISDSHMNSMEKKNVSFWWSLNFICAMLNIRSPEGKECWRP